jgi:hypothetical protein
LLRAYQVSLPWQLGEQVFAVALKFNVLTTFVTPFICVVAVTAVGL